MLHWWECIACGNGWKNRPGTEGWERGCRGEGVARRGFFVLDTNGEESAAPVPVRRGRSLCCWGSSSRLALAVRF